MYEQLRRTNSTVKYIAYIIVLLRVGPEAAKLRAHFLIRVYRRRRLPCRRGVQCQVTRSGVEQALHRDLRGVCSRHFANVFRVLGRKKRRRKRACNYDRSIESRARDEWNAVVHRRGRVKFCPVYAPTNVVKPSPNDNALCIICFVYYKHQGQNKKDFRPKLILSLWYWQ